jgi:hypothetical protein
VLTPSIPTHPPAPYRSENVMFIFLVHPFDVGDTLLLDHVRHDVEEIHLNHTKFLDKDNGRAVWPNRVLRETPFINLTASEVMEDSFHLLLDLETAVQQPDLLKKVLLLQLRYCWAEQGAGPTRARSPSICRIACIT